MQVGTLVVEISIPGACSLKDKRQVVKSLLDTIRRKYNVSAAEVDHNDIWRSASLGFAVISNERALVGDTLDTVVREIDNELRCEVLHREQEIY
jgi:uncharacterized protein YlxP (DUF503 family)